MLRALCQLVNATELTLEACLVDSEDGDWHVVAARAGTPAGWGLPARLPARGACRWLIARGSLPGVGAGDVRELGLPCLYSPAAGAATILCAAAGSISGTFSADSVEEEVFENERFARSRQGSQWSPANLLAGQDPRRYLFALQQADAFPQVQACTCFAPAVLPV